RGGEKKKPTDARPLLAPPLALLALSAPVDLALPPRALELDVGVPQGGSLGPPLVARAVPVVDAEEEHPRLLAPAVFGVESAVDHALLDLVDRDWQLARLGIEEAHPLLERDRLPDLLQRQAA